MTDVISLSFLILFVLTLISGLHTSAFSVIPRHTSVSPNQNVLTRSTRTPRTGGIYLYGATETERDESSATRTKKDNKAMSFLKKIGKIGGTKVDFTNAIGVDEGCGGAKISSNAAKCDHDKAIKKAKHAYRSCTDSGTIDDLSETFPITSSGTQWLGVTDKVMGGKSSGTLVREDFQGKLSNVLTANVSLENDGGFVQMVTDLALDHSISNTVDASNHGGLEFDVFYQGDADKESFNVHLKDSHCVRQFSSYRATFELPRGEWTTVRLPWARFEGFGWGAVENLLDRSTLRRIGLVAIGKEMDVTLALSSIRFLPTGKATP